METSGGNDMPPDRETATLVFFEDFELGAFFDDFELEHRSSLASK